MARFHVRKALKSILGLVGVAIICCGVAAADNASPGSYLFFSSNLPTTNKLVLQMQGGGTVVVDNLQGAFNTCTGAFCLPNDGSPIPNQGWWSDNALAVEGLQNSNENPNYVAGTFPDGTHFRDFFSFDLSKLSGQVTGVTLQLQRWDDNGPGSVKFNAGSVAASITAQSLNNKSDHSGTRDTDLFNALGNNDFGSFVVTNAFSAGESDILNFNLSTAAVVALNAEIAGAADTSGRKWFNIGGSVSDVTTAPVPEPATLTLLVSGLGVFLRRKKA